LTSSEAIIHIGYHKTGTTWFQERVYPLVENRDYVDRKTVKRALLIPHALSFNPEVARGQLLPSSGRPPILCEENLSGDWASAGLAGALSKDMASRLANVFGDAKVVIFIRHQLHMMAALYAQYLKSGGSHGAERLFLAGQREGDPRWRRFKRPSFQFEHLVYTGLVGHYQQVFGAGNVHVYPYERFQEDPAAFLEEYCTDLGLELPLKSVDYGIVNAGFRSRTLRLAKAVNHFTGKWTADKREWLPMLPRKPARALLYRFNDTPLAGRRLAPEELLGARLAEYIPQFYAESNRRLESELHLGLAGYGYPGLAT